ncbi:MAG: helix-turn-helix transcriptional regulator [Synergistaceae bacterium]|nr:helix-turn-helix transcriptional regulator [Synergistaceae bacterium]
MIYLAEFRKKRGLTQAMLAEMVNIGGNSIARYERGEIRPSIEIASRIAKVLEITVEELLNGPDDGKVKLTLVYDWGHMKEGNIDMNGNDFELILGSQGQIGLKGAGMLTSTAAIDEFLARVKEHLTIALDAQKRRGAITEA